MVDYGVVVFLFFFNKGNTERTMSSNNVCVGACVRACVCFSCCFLCGLVLYIRYGKMFT